MKIAGIYLAAGNSRRMGKNKLTLTIGNVSLGSIALQTALMSSLDTIFVIVKETDDLSWIPPKMKLNKKCIIVKCDNADMGQSESLKCGIRQARADKFDAVMVILADQPFITSKLIETIITRIKKVPTNKFIASSYKQLIMPPVLFSESMYGSLLDLNGDMGAKALLHGSLLNDGELVPHTDKMLHFDIDTKEDYEKLLSF